MQQAIELRWLTGTAKGYTDVFPLERLLNNVTGTELLHCVRGPHGGNHHARCLLTVAGPVAVLDYKLFTEFNERHGMEIGVLKLQFLKNFRTDKPTVFWNEKARTSKQVAVSIAVADGPGEVITKVQQIRARQLLRPGQAEFRQILDNVYGAKCCISGCSIPWALEAAHITPFADSRSHIPQDGLLLRADLHALFDANQLAIHPKSRLVFLAPEARAWHEYDDLHGQKKLAEPQPGFGKQAPPSSAFKPRWAEFLKAYGKRAVR